MSVFTDDNDERRWFCRSRYWAVTQGHVLPDDGTMQTLLGWLTQGADVLEGNLQTSAESEYLTSGMRTLYADNAPKSQKGAGAMTVVPTPTPSPSPSDSGASQWDHLTLILGSIAAIIFGFIDFHTGSMLSQAGDNIAVGAGFLGLGVKGITGAVPRG